MSDAATATAEAASEDAPVQEFELTEAQLEALQSLRAQWIAKYGDPDLEEVRKKIAETAERLKAQQAPKPGTPPDDVKQERFTLWMVKDRATLQFGRVTVQVDGSGRVWSVDAYTRDDDGEDGAARFNLFKAASLSLSYGVPLSVLVDAFEAADEDESCCQSFLTVPDGGAVSLAEVAAKLADHGYGNVSTDYVSSFTGAVFRLLGENYVPGYTRGPRLLTT